MMTDGPRPVDATVTAWWGGAALPPGALRRASEAVINAIGHDCILHAQAVYVVSHDTQIPASQRGRITTLLDAPDRTTPSRAFHFLTGPRPGTQSAWSSRATELLRSCGVQAIQRVERLIAWTVDTGGIAFDHHAASAAVHDRMTDAVFTDIHACCVLFDETSSPMHQCIPVTREGSPALHRFAHQLGLPLSTSEQKHLLQTYRRLGRDPTDVELMMYAQATSEHCRHKTFHAEWDLDSNRHEHSLFSMISNTHRLHPRGTLSAYTDNAAVIQGNRAPRLLVRPADRHYAECLEPAHILMKVETHNHPTGISPHAGAATGSGGELRDEGATGRGGTPRAGLTGFHVSDLHIPGFGRPWEVSIGHAPHMASPLQVMLEGPVGAATTNNELGRPTVCGYFRTFLQPTHSAVKGLARGFHKPVMLAGGMGQVRPQHVHKAPVPPGCPVVILGGPAMLVGLGGGSASSRASSQGSVALDFASVQRANPEIQRRCQDVINGCIALGAQTPILSIHDVGAGGLSNAIPELVHGAGRGALVELRTIPTAEPGMSPMQLWCNEAQERYVLAISPSRLDAFLAICNRERAPAVVVGHTTEAGDLKMTDRLHGTTPVDLPIAVLLGPAPRLRRSDRHAVSNPVPIAWSLPLDDLLDRVLTHPTVASKSFLITIGDRSVTGCVVRDQLVGRWQVPVADAAVTVSGFSGFCGEAMAIGERAPVALLSGPASGRLAVTEALTNLLSADVDLNQVVLSANWMCDANHPGEGARLYETVHALGIELCPTLGVSIPVGKDSLSMRAQWESDGRTVQVVSPLTVVVSAFAPVRDVRNTWDPALRVTDQGPSALIHVALSQDRHRMGGSIAAQVLGQLGAEPPDLDHPKRLVGLFEAARQLRARGLVRAWHDVSDGGILVTALEMAFAGRASVTLELKANVAVLPQLFAEEPGGVMEVAPSEVAEVLNILASHGVPSRVIGHACEGSTIVIQHGRKEVFRARRQRLHRRWTETSDRLQALRDDPECVAEARADLETPTDRGLCPVLTFDPTEDITAPFLHVGATPRVAILRDQGSNGQLELAAAFRAAGFDAIDVHMSDILHGHDDLSTYAGLAACGGFSHGDVLGAGYGWASTIRLHPQLHDAFARFFHRPETFSLGVCNGCQMMAHLSDLIPGAEHWPRFAPNRSAQFEARLSQVEILDSPSVLLTGMAGSRIPVPVAHAEGRVVHRSDHAATHAIVAARYVDGLGQVAQRYPVNPNGSPEGQTAFTTRDGRATIMMPHPERAFRSLTASWSPSHWDPNEGPWLRLFRNARAFVG